MATTTKWDTPIEVDDATVAFPANVCGVLIPDRDELPEEFNKNWHHNKWCDIASNLFFKGGYPPQFKKGIDKSHAMRHLQAVLGSYEPKHEHKIGAAGYLLSLWCKGDKT